MKGEHYTPIKLSVRNEAERQDKTKPAGDTERETGSNQSQGKVDPGNSLYFNTYTQACVRERNMYAHARARAHTHTHTHILARTRT